MDNKEDMSSSATFLGYRDGDGNEMHCAHEECPHEDKCSRGCASRKPKRSIQ